MWDDWANDDETLRPPIPIVPPGQDATSAAPSSPSSAPTPSVPPSALSPSDSVEVQPPPTPTSKSMPPTADSAPFSSFPAPTRQEVLSPPSLDSSPSDTTSPTVVPAGPPSTSLYPSITQLVDAQLPTDAGPHSDAPIPATAVPGRRKWPLALLAVMTLAGSGAISWFVANSVAESNEGIEQQTELDQIGEATAQPAAVDGAIPVPVEAVAAAGGQPFAVAAEKIAPSVVQLSVPNGLGTGVIIDADGTILTAAHVVGDATEVRVTFFDGSSVMGTVVGTHTPTDVGVVKIDPTGRDLIAAPIADGDEVRVGEFAIAIGSPFGFDQTVTAGIISAVDRVVNEVSMVQTDAPINPGNSGGPLINLDGEVVGINDLIFTESGTSAGVGFAISIDLAIIVADQLIAGEEVQLALLGVSTNQPANGQAGAQVEIVVAGSAAEAGGIMVGDIVVGVDGDATRGSSELRAQIIDNAPGTELTLTVMRDGENIELTVTLGETGGT